MFGNKKRLEQRDREAGLTYGWRLPISPRNQLIAAFAVVSFGTVLVAGLVKVKAGTPLFDDAVAATAILVPWESGGEELEQMAIRSGPFPNRYNPASDPEYVALRGLALRQATEVDLPYEPKLAQIEIADPDSRPQQIAVFPPLPNVPLRVPTAASERPALRAKIIGSSRGEQLELRPLSLEIGQVSEAIGKRFLISYDQGGRVDQALDLDAEEPVPDLTSWLRTAMVLETGGEAGMLVAELEFAR